MGGRREKREERKRYLSACTQEHTTTSDVFRRVAQARAAEASETLTFALVQASNPLNDVRCMQFSALQYATPFKKLKSCVRYHSRKSCCDSCMTQETRNTSSQAPRKKLMLRVRRHLKKLTFRCRKLSSVRSDSLESFQALWSLIF